MLVVVVAQYENIIELRARAKRNVCVTSSQVIFGVLLAGRRRAHDELCVCIALNTMKGSSTLYGSALCL